MCCGLFLDDQIHVSQKFADELEMNQITVTDA